MPRFEYSPNPNSEDKYVVNFLYKNTNKRIVVKEGITRIEDRELKSVKDSIPNEFIQNENTGVWITKGDLSHDPYLFLNKSKYKLDDAKYSGKLW